ncbi:GntR family transcriptional regulator [Flindersiella endophytica]
MEPEDRRPLVERIAGRIREHIRTGEYGEQLPAEQALADEYDVSRGTIREALRLLTAEGLLLAGRGQGRRVRRYNPITWEPGTFEHQAHRRDKIGQGQDAWASDVTAQNRDPRQDVELSIVRPPALVTERLDLPESTPVVVRRRVRYVDGVPFQLADSYYPEDIARDTPIMEPGDVFIEGGLMKAAGHTQVRFHDEIKIRMPSYEESTRLNLPPMTPVAEHVRTGYNQDGRPVRVIISIVPGDRHIIVYDVTAK